MDINGHAEAHDSIDSADRLPEKSKEQPQKHREFLHSSMVFTQGHQLLGKETLSEFFTVLNHFPNGVLWFSIHVKVQPAEILTDDAETE
jgi:hypothetical protein